jgi:hypothetical protein
MTNDSRGDQGKSMRDALALLEADHQAVETLFAAFERAGADDLDARGTVVRRACEELTIHTIIEEELLYPAARIALSDDGGKDINEAYVEHFLVKRRSCPAPTALTQRS